MYLPYPHFKGVVSRIELVHEEARLVVQMQNCLANTLKEEERPGRAGCRYQRLGSCHREEEVQLWVTSEVKIT